MVVHGGGVEHEGVEDVVDVGAVACVADLDGVDGDVVRVVGEGGVGECLGGLAIGSE